MTNKSKEVAAGDKRRFTLKQNNVLTNDPCAFCGGRCDPGGFDYFADEGTGYLVCDSCAGKYAPEMVRIQKDALGFAKMESDMRVQDIRDEIVNAIKEPVEARVMRVLNKICFGDEDKENCPF